MTRLRDEHGQVTAFVVVLSVTLIATAGLVFDGGRLLTARRELRDIADGAARAGAQALSIQQLRDNNVTTVDPSAGTQAADAFLARSGHHGQVTVDTDSVTVTIHERVELTLLQIVGMHARDIDARGRARLVRGVTGGDPQP